MSQNTEVKKEEIARFEFNDAFKGFLKPFQDEAYSVDSSRGFNLTSIKAQYVVERLNDTVGVDGWTIRPEFMEKGEGVLCNLMLIVDNGVRGIARQATGFSAIKKNVGDAYKGAQTDALCKAASMFGIGNEVFKGNVAPPVKKAAKAVVGKSKKMSVEDF